MNIPAPLKLYHAVAPREWMDYNGHMMDGYYLVAFAFATDALLQYLGFGEAYRAQTGCTIYTVEAHINFLREVKEGDPLTYHTLLLGADAKRLHIFHTMQHAHDGTVLATTEQMWLHVNQRTGRVEPMPEEHRQRVEAVVAAHAALPRPAQVGRRIAMPGA
ncbi:MAG: thioesterase family protein [Anaerolineales bacterium]|nr:thioesterase family protein [Anaerolineales bacterium]